MKVLLLFSLFTSLLYAQPATKIILLNQMVYEGEIKEYYPHAIKLDESNNNQYINYSVISSIITKDSVQAKGIIELNPSIKLLFKNPDFVLSFSDYKPSKKPIIKKSVFISRHQVNINYTLEFNPHKRLIELQNEQFGRIYYSNVGIEYWYKLHPGITTGLSFEFAQFSTSLQGHSHWDIDDPELKNEYLYLSANFGKTLVSGSTFELGIMTKAGIIFNNQEYTKVSRDYYYPITKGPDNFKGTGFCAEIVPLLNYNLNVFAINAGIVFRWSSIIYQNITSNTKLENPKQYFSNSLRFGVGYRF